MITTINLCKSYGSAHILENINVSFKKGMIYGVVGKNGAGKTTLFNCILGLENYTGTICNDKQKNIKDYIGYLPTVSYFFPKTTGKEYLEFCLNAKNIGIKLSEKNNIFDLPLNKYAEKYSTGMKKKLALTGVLLQKNDAFILDEPFNGVDLQSNLIIKNIILHLKKKHKTVIISSHIMSTLTDICDYIFLLKNKNITPFNKTNFHLLEKEMEGVESSNKVSNFIDSII